MAIDPRSPISRPSLSHTWTPSRRAARGSVRGGLFGCVPTRLARSLYSPPTSSPDKCLANRKAVVLQSEGDEKSPAVEAEKSNALAEATKKLAFSIVRLPIIHPLGRIGTYMCAEGVVPLRLSQGLAGNIRIAYEGLAAGLGAGVIKCAAQFIVMTAGEPLLGVEEESDPTKREALKRNVTIVSGPISEAASAPANYVKTLRQMGGSGKSCLQIIREAGASHILNPANNGTGPMITRNFVWIVPFALLRENLNVHVEGGKVSQYAIAALSGGAACVVSYPVESFRILHAKNLQGWLEGGKAATKPNYLATMKTIAAGQSLKQVAKTLFRGAIPATAVMALQGVFIAGMADWNDSEG